MEQMPLGPGLDAWDDPHAATLPDAERTRTMEPELAVAAEAPATAEAEAPAAVDKCTAIRAVTKAAQCGPAEQLQLPDYGQEPALAEDPLCRGTCAARR